MGRADFCPRGHWCYSKPTRAVQLLMGRQGGWKEEEEKSVTVLWGDQTGSSQLGKKRTPTSVLLQHLKPHFLDSSAVGLSSAFARKQQ